MPQLKKVQASLTTEDLLNAARALSPITACADGVPPKAVALLSHKLLQVLAEMGNTWIESTVWPTNE